MPTLDHEGRLWDKGYKVVAGVDEAGWGAWAGPLSVAAAVVPDDIKLIPEGLRDSKGLTKRQRKDLFRPVTEWCAHWAVGHATHAECDEVGLPKARRWAARRARDALGVRLHYFLVDGDENFVGGDNVKTVKKGDARSASIAAASILAKVIRDRIMSDLAPHFPDYGFESNKGENSPSHKEALLARGPSGIHRGSVKLSVELRQFPMTAEAPPVRSGHDGELADFAAYSGLTEWVNQDGVTLPSVLELR